MSSIGKSAAWREALQNLVERAVVVSSGTTLTIDESWLNGDALLPGSSRGMLARPSARRERHLIEAALVDSRGRVFGQNGAATKLGIPRSTLESRIRSLGIDKYKFMST